MNSPRKLIIVGQTPPPHNGQAKMIQQMIDGLRDEFDLLHIRMAYSDSVVSAGKFGLSKIAHLFRLIRTTRQALKENPGAVLYYPPASPNWIPAAGYVVSLCRLHPLSAWTRFRRNLSRRFEKIRRGADLRPALDYAVYTAEHLDPRTSFHTKHAPFQ